jgi:hypothetical protein
MEAESDSRTTTHTLLGLLPVAPSSLMQLNFKG